MFTLQYAISIQSNELIRRGQSTNFKRYDYIGNNDLFPTCFGNKNYNFSCGQYKLPTLYVHDILQICNKMCHLC